MAAKSTFHTHISHGTISNVEATRRLLRFKQKKIYTTPYDEQYLNRVYPTYTNSSVLLRHILIKVINNYHRLENIQLHLNYYTNLIYDVNGVYAQLLPPQNQINWTTYQSAVIGSDQAQDLKCVIFADLCNKGFLDPGENCNYCAVI